MSASQNKSGRLTSVIAYLALTRHRTIQVWNVVRSRWVLRECTSVGHLARIAEGNVIVENRGTITIGDSTRFFGRFAPVEMRTGPDGALSIGEWCSLRWGSSVYVADSVRIGSGTRIGAYCIISDTEVGGLDCPSPAAPQPVVIGEGVWIATRVVVKAGVTIGDGAVIAAGSVVDSDIPPRVVAGGAPARVVRQLDSVQLTERAEHSSAT